MARALRIPTVWSDDDLVAARDRAKHLFTRQRREEGPLAFQRVYAALRPRVERVFEASDDLRRLDGRVFTDDPEAWQAARYVCGPPISQEDLWTLVGGPNFRRVPADLADDTAEAIRVVVDPVRFPWLSKGRSPTPHEREAALLATSVLWAAQQVGTDRRGEASSRQEHVTAETLRGAGLVFDPARTPIDFIDDLAPGTYSRERPVAGAKCDVPVRLVDKRLFALECKVSNGPKNGWKRVNREVGGKAEGWRRQFGASTLTGVVLAGVFDLTCLRTVQDRGVFIFWEHDLLPLGDFVATATA
jgi:hypothetical protein